MKLSSVFSAIVNPLGALSEAAAKTNIPDALMPAVERKIAGTDYTAENMIKLGLSRVPGVGEAISLGDGGKFNKAHADVIQDMDDQGIPGFAVREYTAPDGTNYKIAIDASETIHDGGDTAYPITVINNGLSQTAGRPVLDTNHEGDQNIQRELNRLYQEAKAEAEGEIVEALQRGVTPQEYEDRLGRYDTSEGLEYHLDSVTEIIKDTDYDPEHRQTDMDYHLNQAREELEKAMSDARIDMSEESLKQSEIMQQQFSMLERMVRTGELLSPSERVPTYAPTP